MLHLTAKSTQFGKKTLTSWLIEAAGTVPVQRRKDFVEGTVNNDAAMEKMTQVSTFVLQYEVLRMESLQTLEIGGAVCLFPEGGSRYHPTIAPLKTGGTCIWLVPHGCILQQYSGTHCVHHTVSQPQ